MMNDIHTLIAGWRYPLLAITGLVVSWALWNGKLKISNPSHKPKVDNKSNALPAIKN